MADIFSSAPGTVSVMSESTALPGSISVAQPTFPAQGSAAIITGISYDQSTNQQFQQSLDGAVYIYVFGDKMGGIVVDGIAFAQVCNGGGSGLFSVADYYRQNRISKSDQPIVVLAAGETVTGFLTGIQVRSEMSGADPGGLYNTYKLAISALPQR